MKLGYMNSRRPSKPNLLSVPKPSKLLAPTGLRRTLVFSSLPDLAIRPIASAKPHRLLLAIPQNFPSFKTLYTLWKGVGYVWIQISYQGMTMWEVRRRGYKDFSLRMSSSLSKRWVCVLWKTLHFKKVWVVFGYKSPLKVWQCEREREDATRISH